MRSPQGPSSLIAIDGKRNGGGGTGAFRIRIWHRGDRPHRLRQPPRPGRVWGRRHRARRREHRDSQRL